jgi:hypothetical protein
MGFSRFSIDDWYGSAGASQGPNTASPSSSSTTKPAPMATLSASRRVPTLCQ